MIRGLAQLKQWFGRGKYPTADQFSDFMDSFFHKTEDEIPVSSVKELPERLNNKYDLSEAEILEAKTDKVIQDLEIHQVASEKKFVKIDKDLAGIHTSINELQAEDAAIRRDLVAGDAATLLTAKGYADQRETAIRADQVAGDAAALQAANSYTNTKDAATRTDMAVADAATLQSAKSYTNQRETATRADQVAGDAAALQAANDYTDTKDAAARTDMAAADTATLQSAKGYTNQRETATRADQVAGDAAALQAANDYTDTKDAAARTDVATADAATLQTAKSYTDQREEDIRADMVSSDAAIRRDLAAGDATALQSAKGYADQREAAMRTDMSAGDKAALEAAKTYADTAVSALVNGSPAALDTLQELASALGGDPNFATTVMKAVGEKVEKQAGKGLSTEDYTSAEKTKLAGIAAGANNFQHPVSHAAAMIDEDASHRFITDAERATWNSKPSGGTATPSGSGLMSAADKSKLDGVAAGATNYLHPANHPAAMISEDAAHRFVADTEKTAWNNKAETTPATTSAMGLMSAADKSKLDGVATGATNYVHPNDANTRHVSDAEKTAWNNKAETTPATTSAMGLMSAADKSKLDGVAAGATNYAHPANHPAAMISEDAAHRFVTDAEKTAWNNKAETTPATTSTNGLMSAADKSKLESLTIDVESLFKSFLNQYEPIGTIKMWNKVGDIPAGWRLCDGYYGTVDLRGRFPVGYTNTYDSSVNNSFLEYASVGNKGGKKTHSLTINEMPVHNHAVQWHAGGGGGDAYACGDGSDPISHYSGYSGGGAAHENRPPWAVVCFIQKISNI